MIPKEELEKAVEIARKYRVRKLDNQYRLNFIYRYDSKLNIFHTNGCANFSPGNTGCHTHY